MKNRYSYWSLSPFANWIREKFNCEKYPKSGTSKQYNEYHEKYKDNTGYILANWLDYLQDIVMWIPDKLNDIKIYYYNAIRDETHVLNTGLEKGRWYDLDTRIEYALFNSLYEYVCNELGGKYYSHEIDGGCWSVVSLQERYIMGIEMIELQKEWNIEAGISSDYLVEIKEIVEWWVNLDKDSDWEDDPKVSEYLHKIVDIRKGLWT